MEEHLPVSVDLSDFFHSSSIKPGDNPSINTTLKRKSNTETESKLIQAKKKQKHRVPEEIIEVNSDTDEPMPGMKNAHAGQSTTETRLSSGENTMALSALHPTSQVPPSVSSSEPAITPILTPVPSRVRIYIYYVDIKLNCLPAFVNAVKSSSQRCHYCDKHITGKLSFCFQIFTHGLFEY